MKHWITLHHCGDCGAWMWSTRRGYCSYCLDNRAFWNAFAVRIQLWLSDRSPAAVQFIALCRQSAERRTGSPQ